MNMGRMIIFVMTLAMCTAPLIAQAAETRSLPRASSFKIPGDNDLISFSSIVEGKRGYIKFCLSSSKKVTWWKGIKVFGDHTSSAKALLVTQDADNGPSCRSIKTTDLGENTSRLEFWKAKAFGVHTEMVRYTFYPSHYDGLELDFSWMND